MSRLLSERDYLRFQKCRQISFASRTQPNKFRHWLLEDRRDDDQQSTATTLALQPNALELLQHLAYELVGTIVDLVFQIRQQQTPLQADDPVQRHLPFRSTSSSLPTFQPGMDTVGLDPLLPNIKTCAMSSPFLMPQSLATSQVRKRMCLILF